jgi:D-glycero-alpha-D-manno-heptose-7-phosphate kinase
MIIARSPLRISLGGGGTDLPSYYEENEGFVLSAAIDKYIYVAANRPFEQGIKLKYSSIESCKTVDEISHPLVREVLRYFKLSSPQIEISSMADIPAGTGLGSSGSFTTSLIKALSIHYRRSLSNIEIAEIACKIEIEILNEPVGKQDQYISAVGGISEFVFKKDGSVEINQVNLKMETLFELEDNLLLFYTGISRSAGSILIDQVSRTKSVEKEMLENLDFVKNLGLKSKAALISGNLSNFAELMNNHWDYKIKRSKSISSDFINNSYTLGMKNGAVGGKLVGAGGGGFLLFYASDKVALRKAMSKIGLEEVRFKFDFEGTKVILS